MTSEISSGFVDEAPKETAKAAIAAKHQSLETENKKLYPKKNATYSEQSYWQTRFETEDEYEWLCTFEDVAKQLIPLLNEAKNLNESDNLSVLVLGCGNSPFSADLYDAGITHEITNIDYAPSVIQRMQDKHSTERPQIKWIVMDMTDMSAFENDSFDVVIDKAAMDAILTDEGDVWNPNELPVNTCFQICKEISRITRGIFVQISLMQPHFRKKYLLGQHRTNTCNFENPTLEKQYYGLTSNCPFRWDYHVEEVGADDQTSGCFNHFLYVMRKIRTKSP